MCATPITAQCAKAAATPAARRTRDRLPISPVAGLHLQFGADAATVMVVSWHTLQPVSKPRVLVGRLDGSLEKTVSAMPSSYRDAKSGKTVLAYHAKIDHLTPDTAYLYAALHDGATPEFATFHTAPKGRSAFSFTSFGDQGTPTLGRLISTPARGVSARACYVNDNMGAPAGSDTTSGDGDIAPFDEFVLQRPRCDA